MTKCVKLFLRHYTRRTISFRDRQADGKGGDRSPFASGLQHWGSVPSVTPSSIWTNFPSTCESFMDKTSEISVAGAIGEPAKKRQPTRGAPSTTASLFLENKCFSAISLRLLPNSESFSVPCGKTGCRRFHHPEVGLADHIAL